MLPKPDYIEHAEEIDEDGQRLARLIAAGMSSEVPDDVGLQLSVQHHLVEIVRSETFNRVRRVRNIKVWACSEGVVPEIAVFLTKSCTDGLTSAEIAEHEIE